MSDIPLTVKSSQQKKDFDKKKAPPRSKWSNYMLTINTNKRYRSYEEAVPLAERLKRVIDGELANIKQYITITDKLNPEAKMNLVWFKSISCESVVEIGTKEKGYQPHAHILISINHRTRIRLSYVDLREAIREGCGIEEDIYCYAKLYKNAHGTLQEYLHKAV